MHQAGQRRPRVARARQRDAEHDRIRSPGRLKEIGAGQPACRIVAIGKEQDERPRARLRPVRQRRERGVRQGG